MKQLLSTTHLKGFGMSLALTAIAALAEEENAVYTMDNAAPKNHVLVFHHAEHGGIGHKDGFATGGSGTGSGLSSQSSLLLSHDGRWLFVCNAGSDEVSVFEVDGERLRLSDRVSSGGREPVSLALHRNLLFVLNAGGLVGDKDNVAGFIFRHGKLSSLAGSVQGLSADNTGPAQVAFAQDGNVLLVTERVTSLIDTYTLDEDGIATEHKTFPSAGATPFGFAVGRNDHVFVSEATGVPNGSSASSYRVSDSGDLEVVSATVPTEQQAACWLILSHDERFAYTANAGSGTISRFGIGPQGSLHLLDPNGIAAVTGPGSHPVDMATSHDARFLFVLANGNGTLGAFRVQSNGVLQPLGFIGGIPNSSAGLAAR